MSVKCDPRAKALAIKEALVAARIAVSSLEYRSPRIILIHAVSVITSEAVQFSRVSHLTIRVRRGWFGRCTLSVQCVGYPIGQAIADLARSAAQKLK